MREGFAAVALNRPTRPENIATSNRQRSPDTHRRRKWQGWGVQVASARIGCGWTRPRAGRTQTAPCGNRGTEAQTKRDEREEQTMKSDNGEVTRNANAGGGGGQRGALRPHLEAMGASARCVSPHRWAAAWCSRRLRGAPRPRGRLNPLAPGDRARHPRPEEEELT